MRVGLEYIYLVLTLAILLRCRTPRAKSGAAALSTLTGVSQAIGIRRVRPRMAMICSSRTFSLQA